MDKRGFLKTTGAFLAGSMLSSLAAQDDKNEVRTNWSGNYRYSAAGLDLPASVDDVREFIQTGPKLKALGARHSFNGIADTTGDQISLKNLNQMSVDRNSHTVTLGAGVTYGHLAPYIDKQGYAVHNLASLPHVSVVGACATATHGSGSNNGNLSTAVTAFKTIMANGEELVLSREHDGERFRSAVVGLGGFGIITEMTLNLQPSFQMRQAVYENLSFTQLEKHLDQIFLSGYSVSLFTDWQNHRATQVWIKSRVEPGDAWSLSPDFFGAKAATRKLHPLAERSAENCTEQLGIPGPWYERLPHFRMNFTPSSGEELQTEYFVPRDRGYEAILAVEKLREHITPHLFITEFRTVAADDLWLSPCYKQPVMTMHFTWKPEWSAVEKVLPLIEEQLAPFNARPHWAKLFTMPPSKLQSLYEKMPAFQQALKQHDPSGKFRNTFIDTNIYG